MLDDSGKLWLADFGLAKLADDLSLTGSGELPGTLRYLAPECLRAEPDARSERHLYSLGLTLYELLVGRPAFGETDRVRLLHQIQSQPVIAPGAILPGVPRDLETIILKASAHDPAMRYESAAGLADDLRRFLDGRPILARRASAVERLDRWRRRNPAVAALAALTIVLALFGGYFFVLFLSEWHRSGPGGGPPPPPPASIGPPGRDGRPGPDGPPGSAVSRGRLPGRPATAADPWTGRADRGGFFRAAVDRPGLGAFPGETTRPCVRRHTTGIRPGASRRGHVKDSIR